MIRKTYIGIIKWFDKEKGYGVIATNHNLSALLEHNVNSTSNPTEVFLHIKNWNDFVSIDLTLKVSVVFELDIEKNKVTAKKCKYFSHTSENWSCLSAYLGINELVTITDRHSSQTINLAQYSLNSTSPSVIEDNLVENITTNFRALSPSDYESKIHTILKYQNQLKDSKVISLLNSMTLLFLREAESDVRFKLWKENLIPIDVLSSNDFIDKSNLISLSDMRKIQSCFGCELPENIVLKKAAFLIDKYDHSEFISFDEYLNLISNASVKIDIINNLNSIAKNTYLKSFIELLSNNIGKINSDWDFEQIENSIQKIPQFLSDSFRSELKSALEYYFLENSNADYLVDACLNGFFIDNESVLLRSIREFSDTNITHIIYSGDKISESFKYIFIESLLYDKSKYPLALRMANSLNNDKFFSKIDLLVYDKSQPEEYINLWQKQLGKIVPLEYLSDYFDENSSKYENLNYWIANKIIKQSELTDLLYQKLDSIPVITDRKLFYTVFNIIKFLCKIEITNADRIISTNNKFYELILWHLDVSENFDFNSLKGKFIYFNPDEQVIILKKIFYLKSIGKIDFSIEQLNEIVRADVDLYLNNEKINPDICLDLSTDIIITALLKFKLTGEFLVASDLLSIALKDIGNDKTKRFQLSSYFDKCPGRTIADFKKVAKYKYESSKRIKKVITSPSEFHFAISFSRGESKIVNNYERFIPNSEFEDLKDAIRLLPERRWLPESLYWAVPAKYDEQVLSFGKINNFYFDLTGNMFHDNDHLIEYVKKEIPCGKKFCDGSISQNVSALNNKKFWWCNRSECFENVETTHTSAEWQQFTFLDFIDILGLRIVETGAYGTFDIGLYNRFISQINRFNQLLDRIYCRQCNHILYPVEIGNYAVYSVVRFKCTNDKCNDKNVVYLNHCLNPKCNSIIDSRDSKKCPHGLYICENCGSCCSHKMFTYRLETLKKNGGLLHDEENKVRDKEGHLERAEYFCHKCGKEMREISTDVFECTLCNVKYDTVAYKIDRPNRHLKNMNAQNISDELVNPF